MSFTSYTRIAEQVERIIGKFTQESPVTRQELILHVKQRIARKTMERFYSTKSEEVAVVDGALVVPFKGVPVQYDNDENNYFIELPSSSTSLLYGMNIKDVAPSKNPKKAYIPVINGFNGLYEGMDSSRLQNRTGYYPENDRLVFVNMDITNNPESVNLRIVAPLDGVDDEARVNIPSDMQAEIVVEIASLYGGQKQEVNA